MRDLEVAGLRAATAEGSQPMVRLVQTRSGFLHGCCAPSEARTFLEVRGDKSGRIVLQNNNLAAAKPAVISSEVPNQAVML